MQYFEDKDEHIRQLENENKQLHEKVKLLEHNVEALTQAVLHASKQRFGASTEKTPQLEGQYFFFDKEMPYSLESLMLKCD
jgi:transposase